MEKKSTNVLEFSFVKDPSVVRFLWIVENKKKEKKDANDVWFVLILAINNSITQQSIARYFSLKILYI